MYEVQRSGSGVGEVVRLFDRATESSAAIAVGYGFNCFSFVGAPRGEPLDFLHAAAGFPAPEHKATHHGTPILAPFPNRIRAGTFGFQGKTFELPTNEHGRNAIHGLVVDQPWRLVDHGSSPGDGAWARGEFRLSLDRPDRLPLWPGDFSVAFTYRLRQLHLVAEIEIKNESPRVVPFGLGTHPYFRFPLRPGAPLDDVRITVPASQVVELVDCLPTGSLAPASGDTDLRAGAPLDRRTFDDVFAGLAADASGQVCHTLEDRGAGAALDLRHDPEFKFAVVYTPPHRESVCIEPYTCVTDAVNLEGRGFDAGLWRLEPGEQRRLRIEYDVRPIA